VTSHDVRPLAESEFRDAHDLFVGTLHVSPAPEDRWAVSVRRYEPGRVLGAFVEDELAGTTLAMSSSVAVPGGAVLPAAAVTGVGVRADRTRRGVLTALMRAQLDEVRRRDEPIAMLHASETVIYGRFGYGVACRERSIALDRHRAAFRPDAPRGGRVRLVDTAAAEKLLPEIYDRIGLVRPGMISRSAAWWASALTGRPDTPLVVAVHTNDDGVDDGSVVYSPIKRDHRFDEGTVTLQVIDLQAADSVAAATLWRFLLGVDLVTEVEVINRPLDEPLEWWLTDRRQCRIRDVSDDLWLRLVDVPRALAERTYGGEDSVVIEVRDAFLPENSGCYRVGPAGAKRCEDAPQLSLDVDVLAALYLGDVSVSTLVAANRVHVHDPDAVGTADRVWAVARIPWCGTGF
jgi:predicted acetyltransferase